MSNNHCYGLTFYILVGNHCYPAVLRSKNRGRHHWCSNHYLVNISVCFQDCDCCSPFICFRFTKVNYQNRSVEMEFQAVTADQANVPSILLYAGESEERDRKEVAFKFVSERDLMQALTRTIGRNYPLFLFAHDDRPELLCVKRL